MSVINTVNVDRGNEKFIYIIAPRSFQKALIEYFLCKEIGVKCIANGSIESIKR
jgi:hypothetical protein